ncbi:chromosome 17 open reading frame 53 [Plakobranchus ocellatus]|uniref:Chromosome 17 open reading frame 53 n=1 Tax=Plakobranchus ocellatus TaxID=259542 RepID=A0AAV4AT32_9GAST|nr:chromosome 17 open reading frame 53 [Plakobranchus ocellatus]
MFEIPDDDDFWDDFAFEDSSPSKDNDTNSPVPDSCQFESETNSRKASGNDSGLKSSMTTHHGEPKAAPEIPGVPGRKRSERKFPGPAGLLPAMPANGSLSSCAVEPISTTASSLSKETASEEGFVLPASQAQVDDVCSLPQWKRMLQDLGDDAQTLLSKFSIKALLLRASRKMLSKGKVPLVFGVMENLDMQGADASFVIRDETGKMKGSLHKDLIQDPGTALQVGCVLILRQVSVISPSSRTHYLNVTPGNVVFVYSSAQDASVKRNAWPLSPIVSSHPEPSINDSTSSSSLKEIIEESERELAQSLKNLYNKCSGRISASVSSGSQVPSQPGNRFSSPQLFTSNISYNPRPIRGLHNRLMRPLTNFRPLHTSGPLGCRPVHQFQNGCSSESRLPSIKSTCAALVTKQQLPGTFDSGLLPHAAAGARGYMISGDVAVRQKCKPPGSPAKSDLKCAKGINQNCDKSASSKPFNFECDFFEETEDRELLQFCDESLIDNENFASDRNNRVGISAQKGFEPHQQSNMSNPLRSTSNVLSEVFRDCLNENGNSNENNKHVDNNLPDNKGFQVKSASGRTFTFKRSFPSPNPSNFSFNSPKRKCVMDQNLSKLGSEMSQQNRTLPVLDGNPRTLDSDIRTQSTLINSTEVCKQNDNGQRDSRIQLGQVTVQAPVSSSTHHTDALASWDDGKSANLPKFIYLYDPFSQSKSLSSKSLKNRIKTKYLNRIRVAEV